MRKVIVIAVFSFLIINPLLYARGGSKTGFIKDINVSFLKGDYDTLIKKTEKDIRSYSLTRKEKKEILYLAGLSYIKLNNFVNARKVFNDILDMKGDEFRQEAHIGIADSYFKEESYDKAIEAYEDVLNIYPKGNRLSSVYYNLGLSHKAKNDFEKANFYFKKVKERYNTSFEAGKVAYLPAEKKTNYYIIQLGAFRSLRNAKELATALSEKGYDYYIQKVTEEGRVLYKVRGGKFSNEYYAMRLLRKLKDDRFSAKVIIE